MKPTKEHFRKMRIRLGAWIVAYHEDRRSYEHIIDRMALENTHLKWQPIETCPALVAVLVFAKGHYLVVQRCYDRFFDIHGIGASGFTHWMPLPQPPEENE